MDIIINNEIRKKYTKGFSRGLKDITEIVFHSTAGGNFTKDLIAWMLSSNRDNYYRGVGLFHYAIGRDGEIVELLDPTEGWVYHSTAGYHDRKTIGIEFLNPSADNSTAMTTEQYESMRFLVFETLVKKYPIEIITGHDANARKYSGLTAAHAGVPCPGTGFNWEKVEKFLKEFYPNFKKIAENTYALYA